MYSHLDILTIHRTLSTTAAYNDDLMNDLVSVIAQEAEHAQQFFEAVLDYSQNDYFNYQHEFFTNPEDTFLSALTKTVETFDDFKKSHLYKHIDEGAQTKASLEVFRILHQQITNEQLDSYLFAWNAGSYRLTFSTNI